MSDQLMFTPLQAFSSGVFASGAKATFYRTGTTTPLTVFSDEALTTPHASPLVADSYGVFAQAFTDGTYEAKAVITTSADETIATIDPVPRTVSTGSGASDISITPTTNNSGTDVETFAHNLQTTVDDIGPAADLEVTGADGKAVTGTEGTADNLVKWNADGDAVDAEVAVSTDDTLASDSDAKLPTEQAVKAYVDARAELAADFTLGAVGTYGMLRTSAVNVSITKGTSYSGANLRWAGLTSESGSFKSQVEGADNTAPDGTWTACASIIADSSNYSIGLFFRTS